MKISDVIIIGGGLSGLMAAAVAANRRQKVTVLTYGSGSLPLMSGAIDVLGKTETPDVAIKNLPTHHPYKKIGLKNIDAAAKFFCEVAAKDNLIYNGRFHIRCKAVVI